MSDEVTTFQGKAVHKASLCDDDYQQAQGEPILTEEMSNVDGFSVGFVGSSLQPPLRPRYVHMLTEYVESDDMQVILGKAARGWLLGLATESAQLLVLGQLVYTLTKLHGQNIVHRDIKTENLILKKECEQFLTQRMDYDAWVRLQCAITLIDYGLGCKAGEGNPQELPVRCGVPLTSFIGTPGYPPPEAESDSPSWDHTGDVFSMGAVAMDLLAGGYPAATLAGSLKQAKMTRDVMLAEIRKEQQNIQKVTASVTRYIKSKAAQDVIITMLQPEPVHREDAPTLWKRPVFDGVRRTIETVSDQIVKKREGRLYLRN